MRVLPEGEDWAREAGHGLAGRALIDMQRCVAETGAPSSQVLLAAQSLSTENNRLKRDVGNFMNTVRAARRAAPTFRRRQPRDRCADPARVQLVVFLASFGWLDFF
jgi:hypothetical protein